MTLTASPDLVLGGPGALALAALMLTILNAVARPILILVLWLRPRGLLGERVADKV